MKAALLSLSIAFLAQPIRAVELNCLTEAPLLIPDETIVYKTVDGRDLHLYAFHPQDPGASSSPALLAIHGGGWKNGEPLQLYPHARYFSLRGIAAFAVEFRLVDQTPDTTLHDCISDCNDAVAYARSHAHELGIDPDRIAVMGDSSGGHLAACTGTLPTFTNRANAVINCNGIMDLTQDGISLVPDQDPVVAESWSPLFNVSSNSAPMLHIHSPADTTVLPFHAENMHTALTNSGVYSELYWLQDARHAFILPGYTATQEQIVEGLETADRFLATLGYLSGDPTVALSTIITTEPLPSPPEVLLETNTVTTLPLELDIGTTPSVSIEMEFRLNSIAGTLMRRESFLGFTKRGFNLYFDSKARFRLSAIGSTQNLSPIPSTGSWHTIEFSAGFSNALLRIDGSAIPLDPAEMAFPQEGRILSLGNGLDGEIRNIRITAPLLQTTNGIPIAWLENFGLTSDAGDPDTDGFQTLEEFIAVTNPTNGLDYLRIGIGTNGLVFPTASNRLYAIFGSDSLLSNHWNTVTNIPGTGIDEALPLGTNRFYRLEVSKP